MSAPAATPRTPARVRAHRPSIIDAKVLVIAAIVASPVGFRVSQGLLSVTDALIRYLLVVIACAAVGVLIRSLMPEPVRAEPAPSEADTASMAADGGDDPATFATEPESDV